MYTPPRSKVIKEQGMGRVRGWNRGQEATCLLTPASMGVQAGTPCFFQGVFQGELGVHFSSHQVQLLSQKGFTGRLPNNEK